MKTLINNVRLIDAYIDSDGALLIENGFISGVFLGHLLPQTVKENASKGELIEIIDGKGLVLMPSFVDMHAHFRNPGQAHKEELITALRAAAAGGFGTLLLMPNTNPVISSPDMALTVSYEARKFSLADVIQSISISRNFEGISTDHLDSLDCALFPVVSEDGRDVESAAVMLVAMQKCASKNIIVSCHCEDFSLAQAAKNSRASAIKLLKNGDSNELQLYMYQAERLLAEAENTATMRNLMLAESTGCNIHIAHVSTAKALEAIQNAKQKRGSKISCEVTPHHIALSGLMPEFVNPPIRPEKDRLALIDGIKNGVVDMIATDHAPHSAEEKADGACGFSGLETAFSVCYTTLVQSGICSLSKLSALMSANPAKRLGVNCGILRPGRQADFVLADIEKEYTVDSSEFRSKGKNSPFNGQSLTGRIIQTYRRGKMVFNTNL